MAYLDCKCHSKKPVNADKWRYTLYTTVLFLIVVNPYTYKLTNMLFSKLIGTVASSSGSPLQQALYYTQLYLPCYYVY